MWRAGRPRTAAAARSTARTMGAVRSHLERVADEEGPHGGAKIRIFGGQPVHDGLNLGHGLRFGLPGHRAALNLHGGRGRIGAEAGPAAEQGGVQRRRANQRVGRPRAQLAFQYAEPGEEVAHLHIGVDAQLELAAVRGASGDLDLDPEIPLVRQADFEARRFGDDGPVHLHALDEVAGAEAAVFLVGDGGHQHVAAQARAGLRQRFDRRHARGQAAFHVEGAAAVNLAVADGAGEGLGHAAGGHRVAVPVEHQAAPAAAARQAAEDAGSPGRRLEDLRAQPHGPERRRNPLRDLALARRPRRQRRIDGIRLDEADEGVTRVVRVDGHGLVGSFRKRLPIIKLQSSRTGEGRSAFWSGKSPSRKRLRRFRDPCRPETPMEAVRSIIVAGCRLQRPEGTLERRSPCDAQLF